jgi:hypothetical protein
MQPLIGIKHKGYRINTSMTKEIGASTPIASEQAQASAP